MDDIKKALQDLAKAMENQKMDDIKKALQDLAKAIENQKAVESVRVSIVLKKPKPGKAPKVDDK